MNFRASVNAGKEKTGMAKAARRLRSFTAPNLTPVPAWTRHASRRPKPGTARESGRERGPGPEEAVRAAAAAAPPVGLSAPPTSSKAEPAPEQREEEAVEEEERSEPSPGALRDRVPGGGGGGGGGTAHRQIRAQRAAGAAGERGLRQDRGAARGVGRPVRGLPPSSRCREARWREGTEEGRKEERVSRRAGTGRGTGRQRRGWGEGGQGTPRPGTDGALAPRRAAAGGRGQPGALRGWGWRRGPWDGVGAREKVSGLSRGPGAASPAPCWGWEAPAFPAQPLRWCQVL